jgi:hypothetical protein
MGPPACVRCTSQYNRNSKMDYRAAAGCTVAPEHAINTDTLPHRDALESCKTLPNSCACADAKSTRRLN